MNRRQWLISEPRKLPQEPTIPHCHICWEVGRENGGNCKGHIDEHGMAFEFVGAMPPPTIFEIEPLPANEANRLFARWLRP
jgi:hypothetical protein